MQLKWSFPWRLIKMHLIYSLFGIVKRESVVLINALPEARILNVVCFRAYCQFNSLLWGLNLITGSFLIKNVSSKWKCPGIIVLIDFVRFHKSIPDNFPITAVARPDGLQYTKSRQESRLNFQFQRNWSYQRTKSVDRLITWETSTYWLSNKAKRST